MKSDWTGERLETFIFNETTIEHLHRYAIVMPFIKDKDVLDIASGEGYGSNLMARTAARVTGVDIDEKSVNAARRKYTAPNISFETGMAEKIPLPDASVDVVVSFETIEHHDKHTEMMQEIKRVLKPGGTTIISTPDKQVYSDARNYRNPYHLKELYLHEFESLIRDHFQHVIFLYQKYVSGSLIYSPDAKKFDEVTGDYDNLENIREPQGMYIIAVASDEPLNAGNITASLFRGDEMYSQMISEAVLRVQRSASFRLGNFLLAPFRFFK